MRILICLCAMWAVAGSVVGMPAKELNGSPNVWIIETPKSGIVTLRIEFDGGARLDPEDQGGVTALGVAALGSEVEPPIGGSIQFRTGYGFSVVTVRALVEDLDAILESVASILRAPNISQSTFARVQPQILSHLASAQEDHYRHSRQNWLRSFHGIPAIYGQSDSVKALTLSDVNAALEQQFHVHAFSASIVGDFSNADTLDSLTTFFAALDDPGRQKALNGPNASKPPPATDDLTVKAHARETSIVFGASVTASPENYFVGSVIATVFGGSISQSRLGRRVRHEGGLAYIVEASLTKFGPDLALYGYVGTAPHLVEEVVGLIEDEWVQMGRSGISKAELDAAVGYLLGSTSLFADDSVRLVEQMQNARRLGLGPDFMDQLSKGYTSVSLGDVNKAVARFADPESLKILRLGPE